MDSLQKNHRTGINEEYLKLLTQNYEIADILPCAFYLIKDDPSLTVIYGNSFFYELFGCTEEEMQHKYANSLSALIYAESLWTLDSMRNGEAVSQFQQHIKKDSGDAWIYTETARYESKEGMIFCCVSYDVTQSYNQLEFFKQYEKEAQLVANYVRCDVFKYNYQFEKLQIYNASEFLTDGLLGEVSEEKNFPKLMTDRGLVHPDFIHEFHTAFSSVLKGEARKICELQMKTEAGKYAWVRMILIQLHTDQCKEFSVLGVLENITQQKEMLIQYLNETQFYQAMLVEKAAFAQVDITMNHCTRFGGMWNLYNEVIDTLTYSELIEEFINKVVHPEDRKQYLEIMQRDNFIQSLDNGVDKLGCEFRRIVEQNKMMWMELRVHLFREPITHHVLALVYITNIDEKKKHELELLHESEQDHLTNIYNKKMAEHSIRDLIKWMEADDVYVFMILDLDDFKFINDNYGHKAGDQVLIRLATLLRETFQREDIIGRFGGDEFIIFLKQEFSEEKVREQLGNLLDQLQREEGLKISCSIGISLVYSGDSYERIFQQADSALYEAKSEGKGRYVFYNSRNHKYSIQKVNNCCENHQEMPVLQSADNEEMSFETFIAEQGDLAYLVDPVNFNLICGNKAFYDRIGMTKAECAGIKCYEAMHRRTSPCPFCSKANWSTDKFYLWKNMNTALEQEFLVKNKLVHWHGKEALLAIAIDISNNKSIVDSMENGATESHSILSGVQRMSEASGLSEVMENALETIGYFFRADAVRFFERKNPEDSYDCTYIWTKAKQRSFCGEEIVNSWLREQQWEQNILFESPEAMLCSSYNMYQYMKENNIHNQRWVQLKDGIQILGIIDIDNISSNFQNVAFLESFLVFVAAELRKRKLMEQIIYSNEHDDLTDLLSRASFEQYALKYNGDRVTSVGVLVANMDNLKNINSVKGFHIGNYCLKQFSRMLKAVFPEEAVFRLNGDEFLMIATEIDRLSMEANIQKLKGLVEENGTFSVSIGYSWDNIENNLAVLIEQSTEAMKVDKERHHDRNPISVNTERRRMVSELMTSIKEHRFEVFLQPKVELSHLKVVGAEALIRYRDKELGIITPSKFIGTLEQNNLIRYIDLFVFEEVCQILEGWKQSGLKLPIISLNFSRLTLLERDILSSMEKIIGQYCVNRKYVEIEITESMADMGKSILYQAALELYDAGFHISLDDFGTKYTNLSILADIDFSMLKLDKSLIGELLEQNNNQIILKNIIDMCQDLGIDVIAEGVENQGQEAVLRKLKCKMGQGYLYGKPMPVQEFYEKYIKNQLGT